MTVLLFAALSAFAQEQNPRMPQRAQQPTLPQATPRIVVEKPREPGPGHKVLEPFVGTWKTEVKTWSDASSAPTVSKGTAVFKMIMGGRYLQGDFTGGDQGQSFNAMEIIGFDNIRSKYTGYWIDSTSTMAVSCTGAASADSKVFRLTGRISDPETRRQLELRQVISLETQDRVVFQAFEGSMSSMSINKNRPGVAPGSRDAAYQSADEIKKIEIVCTRVKE